MSLDGLRAWIGEVERKLGMRTRVFLVLTVIAIGGAGAAIYLAIDTRDNAVSESDVQALQQQLEARIGEGGGATSTGTQLESELEALRAQVERLSSEGIGSGKGKSGGASEGSAGGSSAGGSGGESSAEGTSGGGASNAKLQELAEQAAQKPENGE